MGQAAGAVFTALGLPTPFIASEIAAMADPQLAKTASRSVLGTINVSTSLTSPTPTEHRHTTLTCSTRR
jgi:hypothetical protein